MSTTLTRLFVMRSKVEARAIRFRGGGDDLALFVCGGMTNEC